MNDYENYEDVTDKYRNYPRASLADLKPGSDMVIGDLIRTIDGRILIPKLGPEEANLFAVYGKIEGEVVVIAELSTLGEAEQFLDEAEDQGFEPLRWGGFLSASFVERNPTFVAALYPYIRSDLLSVISADEEEDESKR